MGSNVTIEVDEQTADALQARASQLGVTVSELVAELAAMEGSATPLRDDEIGELDRRWSSAQQEGCSVAHDRVVRWLRTWGTDQFHPWPKP